MNLIIIGEPPLATDKAGNLKSHIGTYFVKTHTLISLPGLPHAFQQMKYRDILNEQRKGQGLDPMSEDDWQDISMSAVDLIMRLPYLLIRPVPEQMPLAFEADEALQEIVPKHHIRFLHAHNGKVQQAIRERGENWRISFPPAHKDMIISEIKASIVAIGCRPIYYYNPVTGIRYLTMQMFASLSSLDDATLCRQLNEIRDYASRRNRSFYHEIDFFSANGDNARKLLDDCGDFNAMSSHDLRACYNRLLAAFRAVVPSALQKDDFENLEWRQRMFACLSDDQNDIRSDTMVKGLSPEFFRQIYWHPGARIENGVLVFDPIFEYAKKHPEMKELSRLCDERIKGFICNYVREFGTLQYVNIGGILPELRQQPPVGGHRSYIAEVMYKGAEKPLVRILRIQRWGVKEHLDEGEDLLRAIMETFEYTEYTKNRRLGCWELGMPIPVSQTSNLILEMYNGRQEKYHTTPIWTVYFERDFITGMATDKLSDDQLKDREFSLQLARLLGEAAAPNLVVGRTDQLGNITYDSGDEVVVFDANHMPSRIVVADHAGTFRDVEHPFTYFLDGYARPVISRWSRVPDTRAFLRTYLEAFLARLCEMKTTCRLKPHVFDALFQHSRQGEGTFADRWAKALKRLEDADIARFINLLADNIHSVVDHVPPPSK